MQLDLTPDSRWALKRSWSLLQATPDDAGAIRWNLGA